MNVNLFMWVVNTLINPSPFSRDKRPDQYQNNQHAYHPRRRKIYETKRYMDSTHEGCRAKIPYFSARRPVIKGIAEDPATPIPATNSTETINNHLGRTRVMCWTSDGNIGPTTIWVCFRHKCQTRLFKDSRRWHFR